MADPFATVDNVDALRPLDSDERDLTDALLPYAAAIMRRDIASIDANIASGRVDPLLAQYVNVQMIIRVLRNLDGIRQETVGPSSITYDLTQAIGKLVLTDDDVKLLTPPALGLGIGTAALGRTHAARAPDAERPLRLGYGWREGVGRGPW